MDIQSNAYVSLIEDPSYRDKEGEKNVGTLPYVYVVVWPLSNFRFPLFVLYSLPNKMKVKIFVKFHTTKTNV